MNENDQAAPRRYRPMRFLEKCGHRIGLLSEMRYFCTLPPCHEIHLAYVCKGCEDVPADCAEVISMRKVKWRTRRTEWNAAAEPTPSSPE